MAQAQSSIIMVYNADAGIFNALTDSVHKAVSPDTYKCSLCSVTFGMVSMRHHWRQFLGALPMKKQFFHRDEFAKAHPGVHITLPVIMVATDDKDPEVLISTDELNRMDDLSQLIELTEKRLRGKIPA